MEGLGRKGYNTDRALKPTMSSFPPLKSCPPFAMHYKRLIMTMTAPQVCSMLDLLFSSQAFLPPSLLPPAQTHKHPRTTYCSQLLCQRDSGTRDRGYYMNQSYTTCIHVALIQTHNLSWACIIYLFSKNLIALVWAWIGFILEVLLETAYYTLSGHFLTIFIDGLKSNTAQIKH